MSLKKHMTFTRYEEPDLAAVVFFGKLQILAKRHVSKLDMTALKSQDAFKEDIEDRLASDMAGLVLKDVHDAWERLRVMIVGAQAAYGELAAITGNQVDTQKMMALHELAAEMDRAVHDR